MEVDEAPPSNGPSFDPHAITTSDRFARCEFTYLVIVTTLQPLDFAILAISIESFVEPE